VANTTAIQSLTDLFTGKTASPGGASSRSGGGIFSGTASDNPLIFYNHPGAGVVGSAPTGPFAPDLIMTGKPMPGFLSNSIEGPLFNPNASTGSRVASGFESAGALVGGGIAAYQGFKRGGAGGALAGSSAILGTAAMFDPEPISKGVLAAAAVVTSLLGGFFNNPQKRENAITQALSANQYIAPQALNVTQSSSGTFADFDAKGNLRTSNFSPYPQVSQGFLWEQTHGLFGPPPTWYQVPGGQTGQFGAPVVQHIYQPGSIQTMDAQSFHDYAMKNHMAIGNAAGKNLQDHQGTLAAEVDRRAGR
jgi:hypothetical protein